MVKTTNRFDRDLFLREDGGAHGRCDETLMEMWIPEQRKTGVTVQDDRATPVNANGRAFRDREFFTRIIRLSPKILLLGTEKVEYRSLLRTSTKRFLGIPVTVYGIEDF